MTATFSVSLFLCYCTAILAREQGPPVVLTPMDAQVLLGDKLTIKCHVLASPAPEIWLYRDRDLKLPVLNDGRVHVVTGWSAVHPDIHDLEMWVDAALERDRGAYYCHANNTRGEGIASIEVQVRSQPPRVADISDCCLRQNVSQHCLDICSFDIDFDTMMRKPYCVVEYDRIMHCAADGSDHRECCEKNQVPAHCLPSCRGEPAVIPDLCAITHSGSIMRCLHEGSALLPSPPVNLSVGYTTQSLALVQWRAPDKNPEAVGLYRVYWRPMGSKISSIADTLGTMLELSNLASGTTYEVQVKAGNKDGASQLSAPFIFTTVAEASTETVERSAAKLLISIIGTLLFLSALLLAASFFWKRNKVQQRKKWFSTTMAFENPSFRSRENQEQVEPASPLESAIWSSSTSTDPKQYNVLLRGP